jgi:hypothetical protein
VEFNIQTQDQFRDKVQSIRGARRRKEWLKKVFRGFQNPRRVLKGNFRLARAWFLQRNIQVEDMS